MTAAWPTNQEGQAPNWYIDCFRNALRRVAVTLNSQRGELCASVRLDLADDALAAMFLTKEWDAKLIQFHISDFDQFATDDEFQAEHFFYSDADFQKRSGHRVAVFRVPRTFLDWGYKRLHRPRGAENDLRLADFGSIDDPSFVTHCAANYLVKNFWHNFVHRVAQGITSANYREFSGTAREDSDFEADHLANVFLVRAYGLPVLYRGRISLENSARIAALFNRNRCNLIFAERAQHRATDRASMSLEDRWAELEWRFCRSTSNAISMALVKEGLTPPSVRVFLSGQARSSSNGDVPTLWRTGTVIAEVAGLRINTMLPPYIPNDELKAELTAKAVSPERQEAIRARKAGREREIVSAVTTRYRDRVVADGAFKESVGLALDAIARRTQVKLN